MIGLIALLCAWTSTAMAQGADTLSAPVRLALDPQGGLGVSEAGGYRVVILDPASHTVLQTVRLKCKNCQGDKNDEVPRFGRPLGIAFLGDLMLVGNGTDDNIAVFQRSKSGEWKNRGSLGGGGQGTPVPYPVDIDVDADLGRIFALSGKDRSVMVFDSAGNWLYSFPAPCAGTCPTGISAPVGIAVDTANQLVIVSDAGDATGFFGPSIRPRLQIYDYNGVHQGMISGQSGQIGFQFSRPQGVAVDGFGRVVLADAVLSQVLVFQNVGGQWTGVSALGSFGFGPEQLALPMDVTVDPQSLDVLVVSNRAGRIVVFQ